MNQLTEFANEILSELDKMIAKCDKEIENVDSAYKPDQLKNVRHGYNNARKMIIEKINQKNNEKSNDRPRP